MPQRLVVIGIEEAVAGVVGGGCANEARREPSVVDIVPAALALLGYTSDT
jgi:hypothetical protein